VADTGYKVTLNVSQDLTFHVAGAKDAADAYAIAVSRWSDGDAADDPGWPVSGLRHLTVGDHEVRFHSNLDWSGPVDDRGLHRWKFTAVDDATGENLASGFDVADVARRAIEAVQS